MIDEVLNDPLVIESLTNSLISSGMFFEYLKLAFINIFNQLKDNEDAFFDTYAPFGINLKQLALNKESAPKSSSLLVLGEMNNEGIEGLAERYAIKTIRLFNE